MELLNSIIRYFSRIKVLWKDERELARRITKTNRFVELAILCVIPVKLREVFFGFGLSVD